LTELDRNFVFPHCEERARAFVEYAEKWARDILAKSGKVSDSNRTAFEKRLTRFRKSFDDFANFIEPMRPKTPNRVDNIYLRMHRLMLASVLLGSGGAISDEARHFHRAPLSQGGTKGGIKTGRIHKEKADARWRDKATELYKIHRPTLSQERLADLINDQIPKAPDRRQIVSFIRELDKQFRANGAPQ
jgi:hypothetical protein